MIEEMINKNKELRVNNRGGQAEDFIGWKSPDGKLEVTGVVGKDKWNCTLFRVTCTECSKDRELFPLGYFVSRKGHLINNHKPCGCSKKPAWKDWQYLILARRAGEKKGFIVRGFAEEFKGKDTKLNLECLKDGYKWQASTNSIISGGTGCPKCKSVALAEQHRTPECNALQKCVDICKENNYDIIGFVGGYKGAHKTCFEYRCKVHGKQKVSYNNFVHCGTLCGGCARDLGNGNGYYPERKDEQDYLYVLNFDNKFIKVGRSFDIERRLSELRRGSGIQEIIKLRIFTTTHQEVYDFEQSLISKLRSRNYQYTVDWSTECFSTDCLDVLNNLLDRCKFTEITTGGNCEK